eukprot:315886-Hanusia_phi.AAC.8
MALLSGQVSSQVYFTSDCRARKSDPRRPGDTHRGRYGIRGPDRVTRGRGQKPGMARTNASRDFKTCTTSAADVLRSPSRGCVRLAMRGQPGLSPRAVNGRAETCGLIKLYQSLVRTVRGQ